MEREQPDQANDRENVREPNPRTAASARRERGGVRTTTVRRAERCARGKGPVVTVPTRPRALTRSMDAKDAA